MKRTPIRRISAKRKKQQAELRKIIPVLMERCGGICEFPKATKKIRYITFNKRTFGVKRVRYSSVFPCFSIATDPHHIKPRSQGIDNSPENILMLCRIHHRYIHDHPAWARQQGILK